MRAAMLIMCCAAGLAPAQSSRPSAPKVPGAKMETVHLGNGRRLEGSVVKETERFVFVDVGFDILKVPRASIIRRDSAGASKGRQSQVVQEDLFSRANLPEKSIAKGAAEFGEAVVKIVTSASQGSGFITSREGYVVTNFHVVTGEVEAAITLYLRSKNGFDVKTIPRCKVVAINPAMDLALLKMKPPKGIQLKHVFLGDSDKVKVGEKVYAIGTPIGLERTVSSGIVSVTNRVFAGRTHFQITVPINPGNSGGPLFNLRGEVVGVNASGYTGMQGLNFAIPSKYVIDFLRNRDAFALDGTRTENGVHYLPAPRKPKAAKR